MSKRTSGTFREYLKSRSIDLVVRRDDASSVEMSPSCASGSDRNDSLTNSTPQSLKSSDSFARRGSMRRATKAPPDCDTAAKPSSSPSGSEKGERPASASNNSFLKKYDNEVTAPKTQFESTDDWYASASDMDDSDSAVSKPYGYNAVNPVLECVNQVSTLRRIQRASFSHIFPPQILLQQSMDGIMDNCATANDAPGHGDAAAEASPKDTSTLKKRVHFSTQNSMVQVPRSEASPTMESADSKDHSLSYATIYSNEYEPIGSESNSCNHYVDMESKMGDEHRPVIMDKMKTPPALPPKPANLLKLRQALKIPLNSFMKSQQSMRPVDNESEPDYCSISELQDAVVQKVQIVVDVHKPADDDVASHISEDAKTDFTDETFADVPKLPNVAAIISPKKDASKVITHDNYITKKNAAPMRGKIAPPIATSVSNILSEITAQKASNGIMLKAKNDFDEKKTTSIKIAPAHAKTIVEATKSITTVKSMMSAEKILMPIEAEFDWYNLDVEYGKLTTSSDKGGLRGNDVRNNNFGVEYNLDAEFSLTSSSGSSDNNSSIESNGSTINFIPMTVAEEEEEHSVADVNVATLQQLKSKKFAAKSCEVNGKTFDSFLEHTGLTAKPLPQKRKIFYNAPFV